MEFKERLKALRKDRGDTQETVGKQLNYGYTAISNYESGRNEPSITDIKKIASYFNVSVDYLLCVNDVRNPYLTDDLSKDFEEFRHLYTMLNDETRAELKNYLSYLASKSNIGKSKKRNSSYLKVAEDKKPYKS